MAPRQTGLFDEPFRTHRSFVINGVRHVIDHRIPRKLLERRLKQREMNDLSWFYKGKHDIFVTVYSDKVTSRTTYLRYMTCREALDQGVIGK